MRSFTSSRSPFPPATRSVPRFLPLDSSLLTLLCSRFPLLLLHSLATAVPPIFRLLTSPLPTFEVDRSAIGGKVSDNPLPSLGISNPTDCLAVLISAPPSAATGGASTTEGECHEGGLAEGSLKDLDL
nr:hypothetical protein Itr_chr06CG21670 [Ipomoea trifida]